MRNGLVLADIKLNTQLKISDFIHSKALLCFLTFFLIVLCTNAYSQNSIPSFPDSLFSKYYHQKVSHFNSIPESKNDIIFLGNSITDGGEWNDIFKDSNVKNRGISGDNTIGIMNRLDEIYNRKPAKVFLMIGVNDLKNGLSVDSVYKNILTITQTLHHHSPSTKVYIQSILPVNDDFKQFPGHTAKANLIPKLNQKLRSASSDYNFTYIDLHTSFLDKNGKLRVDFTNDGLHLLGKGYQHWKSLLMPYVYNLNAKPSIIPKPQKLVWNEQNFFIPTSISLETDDNLKIFESQLKDIFIPYGATFGKNHSQKIILKISEVKSPLYENEAYELSIDSSQVMLTANTAHGIFNGLQTLSQLVRDGVYLPGCSINDYPSFAWRGIMHDVGRNYQTIPFLKAQIEEMARYKLNIFHFHLTENVAWRLESKLYPELTKGEFMTRNVGEYYTQEELKDLIQFCKDRYITLVPEIDMPGHSEAFTRAMGVDMQSPKGVEIVKNLLTEFCNTFDVPIIHIGGDEVKITNNHFLPEMIALIESKNKQVMGWLPGGNLSQNTIHQLWIGNAKPPKGKASVDSRFLYINHHDPLESVITIFQHKICDVDKGDSEHLGAITCVWPDRRVANQEAILIQNPFYPSLIATAERTWVGGGFKSGTTLIHNSKDFIEFENRLLDHKELYFKDKPFPYIRQSNISWQITEAFDNKGNLDAQFEPELAGDITKIKTPSKEVKGGTIYLRHWWTPLSESFFPNAKENSTVYAFKKVWSDIEKEANMWIGFNNISRSPATDTPPSNAWDDHKSKIWLNNELIPPYQFARAGQKGNSETPLTDEGYEYRAPTKVHLKKGWNQILVKLPIESFKADWQNPVKWMFTAVFLDDDVNEVEAMTLKDSHGSSLKLDKVFGSNMVMQQGKDIPFWGKSAPNSSVNVLFDNIKKEVIANQDSIWKVNFKPQKANNSPKSALITSGKDTLKIDNILIGDVWLCAGQSNMAFMLKNDQFANEFLSKASNKNLRLLNLQSSLSVYNMPYKVDQVNQLIPENFLNGSWQISDSSSVRDFSAVGYYYGKTIQNLMQIPIGLINVAIGGTPIEAWMSDKTQNASPETKHVFTGDWFQNKNLEPWCIERGHQNLDNLIGGGVDIPQDSLGYNHPFKPTFMYKAAIEPLLNLPIKGVIWYQGESNSLSLERTKQHEQLLPIMVKEWRDDWNQGDFPFYFCQLSSIGTEKGYKSQFWPEFRASQMLLSEQIPNSGIAITADYGHPSDVHPTNKKIVGERLANVSLAKTYGKLIIYAGPKLMKATKNSDQIILKFDQELFLNKGQKVVKFELISSKSNQKTKVEGKINGKEIIITTKNINPILGIRYGWQPYQVIDLVGKTGIPVSSFSIDF